MSLRYGLLGILYVESMTGYQLDKEFKEAYDYIWRSNTSQIYSELGKMEQDGWLTSVRIIQDEKPNRRVYSITEKGRAELLEWLSNPEVDVKATLTAKNAFMLRVVFAGYMDKEDALKLLHSFRNLKLSYNTPLIGIREAIDRDEPNYDSNLTMFWKIAVLHGEIMNEASLKWVEQAIKIVEAER